MRGRVAPADLPTLALAAATISFTALAASLVPIFRALRINPVEALRAE
jgi:ABC-type antimicrobial peptide transport system permease subunit